MRQRCAAALYVLAWNVLPRLPESWAEGLFRLIADIAWRRQGAGVQRLEANLLRVVPGASGKELRALSRAGMRSYLRYWLEVFRLPSYDRDRVLDGLSVENFQAITDTLESGRGVLLALPHMGNWDHAGAWLALHGVPFTTVAERLRPERLYEAFVAYRESLGMEVLPLTGSGSVAGTLARRLRAGGSVCLVADRDILGSGTEVKFFGEAASMAPGPAALALQTGAALLPVTVWFTEEGCGARVHDEVPVPEDGDRASKIAAMTQRMADAFAEDIAAHPQDWHMLQRIFLADAVPGEAP